MKIRTWGAAALLLAGLVVAPATVAGAATMPTAATTGVQAGVTLTAMAGGYNSTSSVTIQNKVITGDATFTGSNLTLRNVRITGHAVFRGDNIVIEDSEFGSWALSGTAGVRATRVDVFGNSGQDGLHITSGTGPVSDVVITDSWLHNPIVTSTSHYDGIQVRGVTGLTLERVLVDLGTYKSQYNAALFFENVTEGNKNIVVKDSWFLGGGYVLYNFATNISVTGTTFGKANFGNLYPKSWGFTTFNNNTSPTGYTLAYTGGDIVQTTQLATSPEPTTSPSPTPTTSPSPSPSPTPTTSPSPSPSPTPTTTTSPVPSASTTGTVSGVSLTSMTGGYIRTSGTTISNKIITGDATFVGSNLTLRNVRVTGTAIFRGDNIRAEDSEFGAVVLSGTVGATLQRVDVFGRSGRDGIQITAGSDPVGAVVIKDSWIHNPVVTSGMSYEGIEVRGVDGLTIDNVVVDLGTYKPELNAALLLQSDNGGSRNVTVNRARLLGGGYVLSSFGTNVKITSSVLGNPKTAYLNPSSKPLTTFTGNTTPTGTALRYTGTAIAV